MEQGPNFLVQLLSPFLLLAFIIIVLCGMAGVKPDVVLKPFFGMVGAIIKGVFDLLGTALRIAAQSGSQPPPPTPKLTSGSQSDSGPKPKGKKPKIKIVVDEDDD